jgi:putative membrane protein
MNFILKIVVYVLVVYALDWLLVGIAFRTIEAGLVVAGCMAVINVFIKPIVQTLAFPMTLMTLGIFPLIINTIFVLIVAGFVKDFVIFGDFLFRFFWAFAFGFLLTVVTVIIEQFTGWNMPN